MTITRVYLEAGKTWTFACAVDHPGWARRGKGEQGALDALIDYSDRYAAIVGRLSVSEELQVIGRLTGTMTTDFGAPDVAGPWDDELPQPHEVKALGQIWAAFDDTLRDAPAELRKGPRGGGRDRDEIADHVREAERAYAHKIGVKVAPRTPWPEQRAAILAGLTVTDQAWPTKYAIRRVAWHVLDHAWEIQDKSLS